MRVETCGDGTLWDAYVEASPDACNYHRWVWKRVINDTCGHQPYYLAAANDGVLQGLLPLFSIKSRTFGNSLVSLPFFSYGGVLASTQEARDALLAEAIA